MKSRTATLFTVFWPQSMLRTEITRTDRRFEWITVNRKTGESKVRLSPRTSGAAQFARDFQDAMSLQGSKPL